MICASTMQHVWSSMEVSTVLASLATLELGVRMPVVMVCCARTMETALMTVSPGHATVLLSIVVCQPFILFLSYLSVLSY